MPLPGSFPRSGFRMCLVVHSHKIAKGYLRVPLRGRQFRVPKKLLDRAQIRSRTQHMSGECVAKSVGVKCVVSGQQSCVERDDSPHAPIRETSTAVVREKSPLFGLGLSHLQVLIQGIRSFGAVGHQSLLPALAHDPRDP